MFKKYICLYKLCVCFLEVQKKTKFAFLARQATCKKMGVFADTPLSQYFNLSRQFRKIDHQNWRHPCFIWGKMSRLQEEIKYNTGPFSRSSFLLVLWAWLQAWSQWSPGPKYKQKWWSRKRPCIVFDFLWNLLILPQIKQGCIQFLWSIFLNSRLKLKYCVIAKSCQKIGFLSVPNGTHVHGHVAHMTMNCWQPSTPARSYLHVSIKSSGC